MNIIYLTKTPLFPIAGGKQLRTYGILKTITELGYNLTTISADDENKLNNNFIKRNNVTAYTYNFKLFPQMFPFFCEKPLVGIINKAIVNKKIDVAIIDYKFYGQYISVFKKRGIKVIYGTHNAQAYLEKIKANQARGIYKVFRYIYYYLAKRHEVKYFNKANRLWVCSKDDFIYHSKFVCKNKIDIIPNFVDENQYKLTGVKKKDYIVFPASFSSWQNLNGLMWFIKYVWDDDLANNYKLILVGKGSDIALDSIKKKGYNANNVMATGFVNDIRLYIAEAKLAIIPLLEGSGTRLKILEAMALKTQVLSTSKGAEGILNSNLYIADTPEQFKKCIHNIMQDYSAHDLTDKAFLDYIENYSLSSTKKKIQKSFNDMQQLDL